MYSTVFQEYTNCSGIYKIVFKTDYIDIDEIE